MNDQDINGITNRWRVSGIEAALAIAAWCLSDKDRFENWCCTLDLPLRTAVLGWFASALETGVRSRMLLELISGIGDEAIQDIANRLHEASADQITARSHELKGRRAATVRD